MEDIEVRKLLFTKGVYHVIISLKVIYMTGARKFISILLPIIYLTLSLYIIGLSYKQITDQKSSERRNDTYHFKNPYLRDYEKYESSEVEIDSMVPTTFVSGVH